MYALRAKKGKGLRPPPFRELSVSHLTSEDPDQPQTCCHDTHDDVEQEVGDGVLSLLAHFELLSPHYTLCTVCEEKKWIGPLKGLLQLFVGMCCYSFTPDVQAYLDKPSFDHLDGVAHGKPEITSHLCSLG